MEKESVGQGTRLAVAVTAIVLSAIGVTSVISDASVARTPPSTPDAIAQAQPPAAGPAADASAAPPAAPPVADASAAPPAAASAAAPAAEASAAPAGSPPGPLASAVAPAELKSFLQSWSNAWASRDTAVYLAFYAPDFKSNADTPEHWRASRKRIMGQAKFIEIKVGQLDIALQGDDLATLTFPFDYASDRLKDHGTKTLQVRRTNGQWLIESETFAAN